MEDVQGMCAKRKESLRSVIGPSKTRPVQQVCLAFEENSSSNEFINGLGYSNQLYLFTFKCSVSHNYVNLISLERGKQIKKKSLWAGFGYSFQGVSLKQKVIGEGRDIW